MAENKQTATSFSVISECF